MTQPIQDQPEQTEQINLSEEEIAQTESALLQVRKEKLQALRDAGINPYPARHEFIQGRVSSQYIIDHFSSIEHGAEPVDTVRFCGRMITRREMGKAAFAHLQDFWGKIQIYARKDVLGDVYTQFCKWDLGDILGLEGKVFRTKTGELSIRVEKIALLSKSLRALPEKWHGLRDIETRSRRRELDLIVNTDSRKVFQMRSQIIQALRSILYSQEYLEVETPMMQSVPGGAVARPFETYHNALSQKFYLRVAPELFLKRCLVGEFPKVFEIGRVFRNEGIDTTHNPEFTILEAYQAYGNMDTMIELCESLILGAARAVKSEHFQFKGEHFNRFTIAELFEKHVGKEEADMVRKQDWQGLAKKHEKLVKNGLTYKVFDHLFDEKIAPHLTEPTFVTEFPSDFSPLAKWKADDQNVAERFELYINAQEVANAYSELNDPQVQRSRLENYHNSRTATREKDDEAQGMGLDESFLLALESAMPPAGGLGIGVDRLVMLLTGEKSIRNVLLFPTLKNNS